MKNKDKAKKIKELTGCLGHKLARGKSAVIKCTDGVSYYTSDVVDIRNVTANGVEIEQSIYSISQRVKPSAKPYKQFIGILR